MIFAAATGSNNVAFAALIWWVIPLVGVLGAIAYVVWISKFQDKYSNETNRSVGNFSKFQASFRAEQARKAAQQPQPSQQTQPSQPLQKDEKSKDDEQG
jgi:hypothetical protein